VLTVRQGQRELNKATTEQREKIITEFYRKLIKTETALLLPIWEKKTGLKVTSWQIKNTTSRWGSCKKNKGMICLSLLLAKKPKECLEYVILHELIHLIEIKHNERFYMFVSKYMPNWKEIKKLLK